jgi:hypothetical protein
MSWPVAFVWTCAIELPIYALVLGRRFQRWWTVCLLVLVANVLTHPALWFLAPRFSPYWLWLVIAESCVVAVETLLFAVALRRAGSLSPGALAFAAALAANAASTAVGLLVA